MALRTDIAYEYDGSFEGFLCCVYEAFYRREAPAIFSEEGQALLYPTRRVQTDGRARKVLGSIREKIGRELADFLPLCLFTCLPQKEEHMLRLIRLGYQVGPGILEMMAHPYVNILRKAVFHLKHEAHLLTGFVRFCEAEGALYAVIHPKNHVLALMEPHFCSRFSKERFLIFDETHRQALVHQPGACGNLPAEGVLSACCGQGGTGISGALAAVLSDDGGSWPPQRGAAPHAYAQALLGRAYGVWHASRRHPP